MRRTFDYYTVDIISSLKNATLNIIEACIIIKFSININFYLKNIYLKGLETRFHLQYYF